MPTYKFDVERLVIKRYEKIYDGIMLKDVQLDVVDHSGSGYFIKAFDDNTGPDALVGTAFGKPGMEGKPKKPRKTKPNKEP